MARPLRIALAGGWYHVFGRGIERRDIFADDRDRQHLIELFSEAHDRYRFLIHAYVLMDNHYHTIIQTPDANLSQGMQWLHGSYSAWFNARHRRVGPLFQGRYRAIPIEDGRWAYSLSFYLHLNPIRITGLGLNKQGRVLEGLGFVQPTRPQVTERLAKLRNFRWSSYRAYGGYESPPAWLECATLLAHASGAMEERHSAYRKEARRIMAHGVEPDKVEILRDVLAIGSREFATTLRKQLSHRDLQGISGKGAIRRRVEIEQVRSWVETIKGEPWAKFGHRHGDWGCALFLWGARRLCGVSLSVLGEAAGGLRFAAVGKMISRFEQRAVRDAELRSYQQQLTRLSNVEP